MPSFLPASTRANTRVMTFVDGENLAKRYTSRLGERTPVEHILLEEDVLVWSPCLSRSGDLAQYIRNHYYTSAPGDADRHRQLATLLRSTGIEAPRVFPRPRSGRSKRVDITLATEMLTHAHRKNYDIAVLVAGDQDYVPLVEAVKAEGCQVALWFLRDGLNPALEAAADHFYDLDHVLFSDRHSDPAFTALYR